MSESSASKGGQELVTRAERGRFAVGVPSANPKGRPKRGETLAESWRRSTDWEKIRDRLEGIVLDQKARHADVIAAASELLDRSWGRAVAVHELAVTNGAAAPARDLSSMPLEQRRALLAQIRSLPIASEPHDEDEPNERNGAITESVASAT